ncbi:DUF4476 domain-containing protein [Pyxidicoccus parkwayensis]|uniref:DUF4476 domain-containing protein n=1 Tax=Pyxidicoccus parkwayensis TaxID=2813578 RepID=A0ABX7P4V2_9BACT|nr:DUF4476 domain-containing protein [Pyxidicoccus parkwaysis]QSQ25524.1 DUF4476 domain-containing protein [Pyxidicoccus parkwaysis]
MKAWVLVAALASTTPSLAQSFASKQVSHQWNTKSDVTASVYVTEPEGAIGEISRGGKVLFRAEIPFRWEPRDIGPHQFTVTTKGGETWTKELNIESMKSHQLRVQLASSSSRGGSAPAPAANAAPATEGPPTANVAIGPETYTWNVSSDVTCTVKVLEPEGATGEIWAGNRLVKRLEIPFLYSPNDVGFYKFVVRTADGKVWAKKLEVEGMKMHKLTVKALGAAPAASQEPAPRAEAPAPAPAPRAEAPAPAPTPGHVPGAVSDDDFAQVTEAINDASMSGDKLRVVQMVSRRGRFSVYQVGQLVDMFSMSDDKVNVVRLLRGSIADRKNAYQLLSKFTFSTDKEQVQKLLAAE